MTDAGNYFHGGSSIELIALQTTSVIIIWIALMLLPKVGKAAKLIIIAATVIPILFVLGALREIGVVFF